MSTADEAGNLVRDNPEQQRFELATPAGLAVAEYRREGNVLTIFHTEVPPALRGQGIGEKLVRGVLDEMRQQGLKVVPRCWFVREFLAGHPEYRDVMA
jgi:predicted GNAT family acetyltransferase